MTKKQALTAVVNYIEKADNLDDKMKQALEIVKDMKNGVPGKIWDKESIEKAIERFKKENGRYPSTLELDRCVYLPSHAVVCRMFNMTAGEWLHKNYPYYDKVNPRWGYLYGVTTLEQLKEIFVREYTSILPKNAIEYNKKRQLGTPTWQFLADKLNTGTWYGLIKFCGLEEQNPAQHNLQLQVRSNIEF